MPTQQPTINNDNGSSSGDSGSSGGGSDSGSIDSEEGEDVGWTDEIL